MYCTVYTHAPFRTCHEDSEKTVLDEWGTQNAKQNKNAEILKDVKMMMGKLIQESGESYSCSTVHQYHMGPCVYGAQVCANSEKI